MLSLCCLVSRFPLHFCSITYSLSLSDALFTIIVSFASFLILPSPIVFVSSTLSLSVFHSVPFALFGRLSFLFAVLFLFAVIAFSKASRLASTQRRRCKSYPFSQITVCCWHRRCFGLVSVAIDGFVARSKEQRDCKSDDFLLFFRARGDQRKEEFDVSRGAWIYRTRRGRSSRFDRHHCHRSRCNASRA